MRQPVRSAAATTGPSARSDTAITANSDGGLERLTSLGSESVRCPTRPTSVASDASAARTRAATSSAIASAGTPAGSASDPSNRQREPIRPISATDVVAAPWSIAKNARGSLVNRASRYLVLAF